VAGAKNNLQFTGDDSSLTRMCAASLLKYLTLHWAGGKFACGPARWSQMTTVAGSRRSVERGLRKRSYLSRERDDYLAGEPADDARFVSGFAHALEHTGGYSPPEAARVAGTLLPDLLTYHPARPASFPHNGRTLTDDAFDSFISVMTNGKVTDDKVRTAPRFAHRIPVRRAAAHWIIGVNGDRYLCEAGVVRIIAISHHAICTGQVGP
jgi:hypothetical protein